jgi:hypothetical protein
LLSRLKLQSGDENGIGQQISTLNIPTGLPIEHDLDDDLQAVRHHYRGDAEEIQAATASVAA